MEAFGDGYAGGRRTLVVFPEAVRKHKGLRRAIEAYERVVQEHGAAKARLQELFAAKERAERAALEAEAKAIREGEPAPAVDHSEIEAEIAATQRRLEAVELAFNAAQSDLAEAFEKERPALLKAAGERIEAAAATLLNEIEALSSARSAYFDERRLATWLVDFPRSRKAMPGGDAPVRAILSEFTGEPLEWSRFIGALRAELEPPAAQPKPQEVKLPLRVAR